MTSVNVLPHYVYSDAPGTIVAGKDGLRNCPGGIGKLIRGIPLAICPVCWNKTADFSDILDPKNKAYWHGLVVK